MSNHTKYCWHHLPSIISFRTGVCHVGYLDSKHDEEGKAVGKKESARSESMHLGVTQLGSKSQLCHLQAEWHCLGHSSYFYVHFLISRMVLMMVLTLLCQAHLDKDLTPVKGRVSLRYCCCCCYHHYHCYLLIQDSLQRLGYSTLFSRYDPTIFLKCLRYFMVWNEECH